MQVGVCDQSKVQIKNIKLHIVTDIKVTINSLSVFGFRYLVGGRVTIIMKEKPRTVALALSECPYIRKDTPMP